nr:MAG TPA: hypothetical protein [Caudoviricetes sp.]
MRLLFVIIRLSPITYSPLWGLEGGFYCSSK